MNIILFHFGIYSNENHEHFPVYKKCYDRVLEEFKDDKIYVFNSMEEVFNTFDGIQKEFESYQDFLFEKSDSHMYASDLLRLLMSHYIEDYLYLDSDIYIFKGFRDYLLSKIDENTKLMLMDYGSTCICYCKTRFKELDFMIKKIFNYESYTFDADMNRRFGLLSLPLVKSDIKGREMESHFHSLHSFRENVKKVLILSGQDNDTEDKAKSLLDKFDSSVAGATDSWLAFKDYQGCIKTHFFPKESSITLDDVITSCNIFNTKTYELQKVGE